MIIKVLKDNQEEITKRLEKFNKKLNKYNKNLDYSFSNERIEKKDKNVGDYAITVLDLEIEGSLQHIEDKATMLCRLEHSNPVNIVKYTNAEAQKKIEQLNKNIYTLEPICEHCNTVRNRKYTYFIEVKETGEILQVANTCLENYIHNWSLDIEVFELMEDLQRITSNGYLGINVTYLLDIDIALKTIEEVLKITKNIVSSKDEQTGRGRATWRIINEKIDKHCYRLCTGDTERYTELKNYLINFNFLKYKYNGSESRYDWFIDTFEYKMLEIVKRGWIKEKEVTILVYFFSMIDKLKSLVKAQEEKEEKNKDSKHYKGNIKDKIKVEVTLERVNYFETMYGTMAVYTFKDTEEHTFIWKTAKDIDKKEGDRIGLQGTIKDFTEFNGVKQTELTRCKVD